jgi:hypothetical protein
MPPASYAIAPLAHHIVWTYTQWPKPTDGQDSIVSYGVGDWIDYANRNKYPDSWDDELVVEVDCPICDSETEADYIPAKVLLESDPLDQKLLVPEGFLCYICGMQIDPTQRYLAKHFVPPIPPETAARYLEDIGIK